MSFSSQQPYEANLEESGWGMQNHFRGYWSLLFPFPTLGFCHGVVALWHLLKPASEEMTPWYLLTCREDFKHGRFPWEQEGAALWETELTWMKTTMKQFSYGNNPGLQWSCECSTVQPCLPRALLCFIQGSAPAPPSLQLTAWVPGRADPAAIPQGTWCLWHGVVKAPWKGTLLPSGSGFNASIIVPVIISAKIKAAKLGGETVLASVMLFKIRENLLLGVESKVSLKPRKVGAAFCVPNPWISKAKCIKLGFSPVPFSKEDVPTQPLWSPWQHTRPNLATLCTLTTHLLKLVPQWSKTNPVKTMVSKLLCYRGAQGWQVDLFSIWKPGGKGQMSGWCQVFYTFGNVQVLYWITTLIGWVLIMLNTWKEMPFY